MNKNELSELNKKANRRFMIYVALGGAAALLFWLIKWA